jgi:inosine-uridine nucleoside N-ribohydrolase
MKFVMDCDTGHDDALALLLAARHLDIVGVTTVYGSSTIENTTANTLAVLDLAGIDVPVMAGCAGPLSGLHVNSPTHGKTGLDGATIPRSSREKSSEHAVDFLIASARTYQKDLVIVATGPLTNLATALQREPLLASWVTEISIMGGSAGIGNRTPVAEANFVTDPEAAAIVLASGAKCRLVGYELTRTFGLSLDQIERLAMQSKKVANAIAGFQRYYLERQKQVFDLDFAPVHDPCAVICYIAPDLIQYEKTYVRVEVNGDFTRGMSVYDRRGVQTPLGAPVERAACINSSKALELIIEAVMSYS